MTISPEEHLLDKLQKVLKIDLDYRLGKTLSNDLFEFSNKPNKEVRSFTSEFKQSKNNRIRNIHFEKNYTEFLNKHFLLTNGMLVAGGSLVSFLYYPPARKDRKGIHPFFEDEKQDVDIFFYGLTAEQIKQKITESIQFIKNKFTIISLFSNDNVFSVTFKDTDGYIIPVQFILRCYESPSHILHAFDLGCCSIGYDAATAKFYTTSFGKFCLKYRCNVIDTVTRNYCGSCFFQNRLQKYYERGFSQISNEGGDESLKKKITPQEWNKLTEIYRSTFYCRDDSKRCILELSKIDLSGCGIKTLTEKIMNYIIEAFVEENVTKKIQTVKSREIGSTFVDLTTTVISSSEDKLVKKEEEEESSDCDSEDSDFKPKNKVPCKKVAYKVTDEDSKSTVFKGVKK